MEGIINIIINNINKTNAHCKRSLNSLDDEMIYYFVFS